MEKNRINRFVQKYNLGWFNRISKMGCRGTTLSTSFISDDKSVLGTVSTKDFDFDKGSYGVYDTTKFTKMLSVLENDVDLSTTSVEGKSVSLNISDKGTSATYMLADLSVIPVVPDLKQLPNFNVEVTIDSTFINRFNKALQKRVFQLMKRTLHSNVKVVMVKLSLDTQTLIPIESLLMLIVSVMGI